MDNSRSKNATLNIIVGWSAQICILILSFASRRIFVQFLSVDYLGINGLYGNILSVLALAELGLGNVTQFFLYKPVANKDYDSINRLVIYFRRLYNVIAASVLVLGLSLIPFLQYIVNSDLEQNELVLYYVLFLVNSCVTYFSADKVSLLAANQDNRLTKYLSLAVSLTTQILHIAVLAIWHNYTVYVLVTLLGSVITAVATNLICYKKYPFLKNKHSAAAEVDKKYIVDNLKSTFVYKIGATIINNTDNILISVIVSTAAVGLYSNYLTLVLSVQMFVSIVTTSLISGIGNLSANGNKARMLEIFNYMLLVYHFIGAFCGVEFFLLFDDLIPIWLGEEFLLDNLTVFAIALSFYQTNAVSPVWMFREANGLFSKVKYLLLCTAAANIVLSVILGKLFGVFGILIATTVARIITQVWYEPKILFKNLFGNSAKFYWIKQLKYFLISALCGGACYAISMIFSTGILSMLTQALIYLVIFVCGFWVFCRKTKEVAELKKLIKRVLIKKT